ncbi:MAG: hypothetical protein U1B30_02130 [Pseudomonadota bacterium]|nr:hypothetical protein [Pseudomonadota bacterium]
MPLPSEAKPCTVLILVQALAADELLDDTNELCANELCANELCAALALLADDGTTLATEEEAGTELGATLDAGTEAGLLEATAGVLELAGATELAAVLVAGLLVAGVPPPEPPPPPQAVNAPVIARVNAKVDLFISTSLSLQQLFFCIPAQMEKRPTRVGRFFGSD